MTTTIVMAWALSLAPAAVGQPALVVKPLAEKRVSRLPDGPLAWRVEVYPSRGEAERAAGELSLVAESKGKVYLFTLGPAGSSAAGAGTKLGEVGPLPPVMASQYLLRVNEASGPPGSITPVHTHPGSEAFFVLAGEQTIRSPHGVLRVTAGKPETGHGADVAMQVSSSGTADLHSLVMFVVDATRPFSSPATFP